MTAGDLWSKVDALMTDSVSKNLSVEELVSEKLSVETLPSHLLCKSHCVEGLDRSNISVLSSVEKEIKMAETFIGGNPNLRSWFQGEKAVVVAGIKCLLNLVSHQKSPYVHVHMSIYQERRFAKLGMIALSLVEALPLIQELLR